MLLIATSLSLLAIVAGMFLLAQTKKENLGNLFKYVSYFVVITGFLSLICIGTRCVMRCSYGGAGNCGMMQYGGDMKCKEMMMDDQCHKGMKMKCCSAKGDKHEDEEMEEEEDSTTVKIK